MSSSPHTIIAGGGIMGVASAYYLARRGTPVTLLERARHDDSASAGNAGIIALGHVPLPRPGVIRDTLKLLFDETNPLYIRPRLDLSLLRWFLGFRRACTPEHFKRSMKVLAELGWATGECFREIVDEEGIECEYSPTGWMDVVRTEAGFDHARVNAEATAEFGFNVEEVRGDEFHRREPAFRDEVLGAVIYTDSGYANPRQFLDELAQRAVGHGAQIRTDVEIGAIETNGRRVTGVTTSDGERLGCDALVLAAGIWTTGLARSIGVRVPMQAGKGYHVKVDAPDPKPGTVCVCNETFVAVTPIDGGLRLAGTVELSGINRRIVQKRLDALLAGAKKYIRGLDDAVIRDTWCGMRPLTADGLPVIDRAARYDNVVIATGHAMMGFALGPITGRLVSELVLDGRPSMNISDLRLDR